VSIEIHRRSHSRRPHLICRVHDHDSGSRREADQRPSRRAPLPMELRPLRRHLSTIHFPQEKGRTTDPEAPFQGSPGEQSPRPLRVFTRDTENGLRKDADSPEGPLMQMYYGRRNRARLFHYRGLPRNVSSNSGASAPLPSRDERDAMELSEETGEIVLTHLQRRSKSFQSHGTSRTTWSRMSRSGSAATGSRAAGHNRVALVGARKVRRELAGRISARSRWRTSRRALNRRDPAPGVGFARRADPGAGHAERRVVESLLEGHTWESASGASGFAMAASRGGVRGSGGGSRRRFTPAGRFEEPGLRRRGSRQRPLVDLGRAERAGRESSARSPARGRAGRPVREEDLEAPLFLRRNVS